MTPQVWMIVYCLEQVQVLRIHQPKLSSQDHQQIYGHYNTHEGFDIVLNTPVGILGGGYAQGGQYFRSVPYGRAEGQSIRFSAAVLVTALQSVPATSSKLNEHNVWNATQFSPGCPQQWNILSQADTTDESECLTLNVFAPRDAHTTGGLPVVVFIHGNDAWGAASQSEFDPLNFAVNANVIVVTFDYRVGLLGYFNHPALLKTTGSAGNYGLLDQQLVLQWVNRNIAALGGDASMVTVWGEGEGGSSALIHALQSRNAGFIQGVMSTGGGSLARSDATVDDMEITANAVLKDVGCDPSSTSASIRSCLMNVDAARFVGLNTKYSELIRPVIDGATLKADPRETLQSAGLPAHITSAVLGYARNSSVTDLLLWNNGSQTLTYDTAREAISRFIRAPVNPTTVFNDLVKPFLDAAQQGPTLHNFQVVAQTLTDALVRCPVRQNAQWIAAVNGSAVRVFEWTTPASYIPSWAGVPKHADLSALFEHACFASCTYKSDAFNAYDDALNTAAQSWWAALLRSESPSSRWTTCNRAESEQGCPEWQVKWPADQSSMHLPDGTAHCSYFATA